MIKKIIRIIILFIYFSFVIFPILWIVGFSFKQEADITAYPPKFIFKPTLYNYFSSITGKQKASTGVFYFTKPQLPLYLKNTMIITISTLIITVIVGIPAAYSLAKLKMKGKRHFSFLFLSFRFLPELAVILPIYLLYNRLNLVDTYHGLALIYQLITLPLFILIMRVEVSFFSTISRKVYLPAKGESLFGGLFMKM